MTGNMHFAPLATLSPSISSRTWQSAPHPSLPLLATTCADRTIRIYSLTTFTLLTTLTGGHRRSVRTCAWKPSPYGSSSQNKGHEATNRQVNGGAKTMPRPTPILATGSFDATAAIWVGPTPSNHVEDEDSSEQDADGESEEYRFAVVLEGHDSEIKSLAWSAHGTYLATCSRDKSVWVWECLDNDAMNYTQSPLAGLGSGPVEDEDNYETVAVLQEHDGDVKCVAWHPEDETCLASSSYDERVRIWREDSDAEWRCVAVCEGHEGTVWCVAWEPAVSSSSTRDRIDASSMNADNADDNTNQAPELVSGPRIITCADDLTIRVWRRKPKPPLRQDSEPRIPSIIRSTSDEEEWYEEGRLPQVHERAVYTVAWSTRSRRVVSAGSDGKIVIYEERPAPNTSTNGTGENDLGHSEDDENSNTAGKDQWLAIAELENAHGVFEINHVCWSTRWDRGKGNNEEVIISTGDDGEVKVWSLS